MVRVLVVDAANVVGSRPDGWWRDRSGAACRLHDALVATDLDADVTVLVLEGRARQGHVVGRVGDVETVHAPGSGDDEIVRQVDSRRGAGDEVVVITADRELRERVTAAGGACLGPSWLLDRLPE